jgi:RNA polymerase sigma-70 factor (ECF subfamily)
MVHTISPRAAPEYDTLFRTEWTGVLGHLNRAVRDKGLAEDLAQETFVRAAQGLAAFRGECSPRTWLRRIAANVLHDHWRSRGSKDTTSLQPWSTDDALQLADPQPSPALAVERREVQACLAGLIADLPSGEREALILAVRDDMPPREIARSLRLAPEAARARLHRARRKMAAMVADRCVLAADEGGALSC